MSGESNGASVKHAYSRSAHTDWINAHVFNLVDTDREKTMFNSTEMSNKGQQF